jgi:DNA-binding transcriptional regulator GbsR (MarR family)
MTDKSIIDDSLILKLHSERRYVVLLVNYITNHLVWGHNYISLIPKDIIASTGIDKSDISKAIKRLVELEIIKQASSVKEEYKDIDKHVYIINHNYIFKGNIKNLIKDIKGND